jgi:hypothetical protein
MEGWQWVMLEAGCGLLTAKKKRLISWGLWGQLVRLLAIVS